MGVKNLLRTGQFFGLQYIYQTLTNSDGADPIDYPAIVENPAEFELVATDAGCAFSAEQHNQILVRQLCHKCLHGNLFVIYIFQTIAFIASL